MGSGEWRVTGGGIWWARRAKSFFGREHSRKRIRIFQCIFFRCIRMLQVFLEIFEIKIIVTSKGHPNMFLPSCLDSLKIKLLRSFSSFLPRFALSFNSLTFRSNETLLHARSVARKTSCYVSSPIDPETRQIFSNSESSRVYKYICVDCCAKSSR